MEKLPSNESSESYFAEDLKFLSRFKDTDVIQGLTYYVPSMRGFDSSDPDSERDNYRFDSYSIKGLKEIIQECKNGLDIRRSGYPYTFIDPTTEEVFETELGILYPQLPDGTR